ncbi:MAG: MFS transporter, partial [Oscillospiraceae bacterium]|nr:MFS transporter [Oscillospiraceae bacterium]
MAKKERNPGSLTTKHWFGYMFGDWGGCMTFTLMASIFGLYCTNVLGIDPVLMGTLTIIWTVWDAINDPMMGALMDKAFARKHNKNGKFRPWLLRATPMLAVSAICLWTVPTFLDGIPMLVALFSFKILYEGSYTMFNIPMGSLLSAMSTNDSERASLSSARGVGSMFGNMIPGMVGPVIIGLWDDRTATGYMITGVACAAIGFVICLLHYALTEERTVVGAETKADDIKFSDILVVVKKNRPFVALCIHGVCICLMQYAAQTLGLYMYSGVYHDVTYQTIASALSSPFMIGSMIAVPFMCKKLGLEKLIRNALLIGGAICGGLFVLHLVMDVHPLIHGVLLGLGSGFAMVSIQMQWGLVGEAIDYNEYITGKRTEGSIYGTFNLSRRIGQTVGLGISFFALDWIGYVPALEAQSASTVFGFKILCVLVPAVFILGSWAAFKFVWNITPEVRAEMAAKKAAAA